MNLWGFWVSRREGWSPQSCVGSTPTPSQQKKLDSEPFSPPVALVIFTWLQKKPQWENLLITQNSKLTTFFFSCIKCSFSLRKHIATLCKPPHRQLFWLSHKDIIIYKEQKEPCLRVWPALIQDNGRWWKVPGGTILSGPIPLRSLSLHICIQLSSAHLISVLPRVSVHRK